MFEVATMLLISYMIDPNMAISNSMSSVVKGFGTYARRADQPECQDAGSQQEKMDDDVGCIVDEVRAIEIVLSLSEIEDCARYDRKSE